MSFGDRLRAARNNKGYSQKQLAKLISVSNTAISNYEQNTSFPNTDILYKLFDALECEPNFLFWDELTNDLKNKILSAAKKENETHSVLINAYENHPDMQPAINKMLDIQGNVLSISDDLSKELEQDAMIPTNIKSGL